MLDIFEAFSYLVYLRGLHDHPGIKAILMIGGMVADAACDEKLDGSYKSSNMFLIPQLCFRKMRNIHYWVNKKCYYVEVAGKLFTNRQESLLAKEETSGQRDNGYYAGLRIERSGFESRLRTFGCALGTRNLALKAPCPVWKLNVGINLD